MNQIRENFGQFYSGQKIFQQPNFNFLYKNIKAKRDASNESNPDDKIFTQIQTNQQFIQQRVSTSVSGFRSDITMNKRML
jgi:hypothetical protein